MFRKLKKIGPLARAIAVVGATGALVTGVTMAAFQTNAVALVDGDLSVNTDVLRISNGGAYNAVAVDGFSDNVTPGIEGPKHAFYLQNLSNADLAISASITGLAASSGIDGNGIIFRFYDETGTQVLAKTYTELATAPQTLTGQLEEFAQGSADGIPTEGDYSYSVTVNPSAVTGSPASLTDYDLSFTGTSL